MSTEGTIIFRCDKCDNKQESCYGLPGGWIALEIAFKEGGRMARHYCSARCLRDDLALWDLATWRYHPKWWTKAMIEEADKHAN